MKELKDQFIGMDIKQKVRIKIQQMNIDIFSNQILLLSTDYYFLVYWNKTRRHYFPEGIIKNYNAIINGKDFFDQAIDSDKKWNRQIRKQTTGQCEDYTTGHLLDYEHIKNHYRLIAVDLSRKEELDIDPKKNSANRMRWTTKKCRSYKCCK